ncbi:MAG: glucose-1-phosphate adenylyltransferase subunit GlgD, partial [Lachnospirales bacterium]
GLYIFTPFLSNNNSFWFRGVADSIYQNISFLKRSHEPYVVIASGDGIYKMDYQKVLEYHEAKGADITIVTQNVSGQPDKDPQNFGVMTFDEDMKMTSFEEKPIEPKSDNISLGIYVISRTLLIKLLENAIPKGYYDLVKDIILRNRNTLKIYGYKFDEYWNTLNSIEAYVQTNMDFLNCDVRNKLLYQTPYIDTKPSDDPPAKYNSTADVKNTLVGTGTIIDGSVANSILFRKVKISEGASVKDSIIMKGSYIGKNCVLENVIIDKECVISDGKQLIGTKEEPIVIKKGQVV